MKFPLQLSGLVPAWLWWLRVGASHPLYRWGGTILIHKEKFPNLKKNISSKYAVVDCPNNWPFLSLLWFANCVPWRLDEYQSMELNTRLVALLCFFYISLFGFVMKHKYKDQIVHQVGWGRAPDPDSGLLNPRDVDWQDSVFMWDPQSGIMTCPNLSWPWKWQDKPHQVGLRPWPA